MRIPSQIREKVELRNKLNKELEEWFIEQGIDLDGMSTDDAYICDEAIGKSQGDGEVCYQIQEYEDSFSGTYYWKCDNGEYLAMDFWV